MEDTTAPDSGRCIRAEIQQLSEQNRRIVLAVELALFFGQNSQALNEENKGSEAL